MQFFIIFSMFFSLMMPLAAAIKPVTQESIYSLQKKLHKQQELLQHYKQQIVTLENNLNIGNRRLKHFTTLMQRLDKGMFKLEKKIRSAQQVITQQRLVTKKILQATLLEQLNSSGDEAHLAAQKLLLEKLAMNTQALEKLKKDYAKQLRRLKEMKDYYAQVRKDRQELINILNSVELNKLELVNKYVSQNKQIDKLQHRISKQVTHKRITKINHRKSLVKLRFMPPVDNYVRIQSGKKGVSYYVKTTSDLKAVQDGKVIYQGRLATYGNVIMIEHSKLVKSILLGDFTAQVKKGAYVRKGQVIGRVSLLNKTEGTIYFEVRRKNIAQNTIYLLDKRFLKDRPVKKL